MEQVEQNARLIAARLMERDGHPGAETSRAYADLYELAKGLLLNTAVPVPSPA